MNSSPSREVTYAGWSRANVEATSGVAIHHPNGDVKKISLENDNLTNVPIWTTWVRDIFGNPVVECPPNTHWQAIFDSPGIGIDPSTVQPGSSGSPIFNQNHQVVGQLHGDYLNTNNDFCDNRRGQFGRFDISWGRDNNGDFLPGRNAANSLAPWLDPNNTNAMATNTTLLPTISGPDFLCSSSEDFIVNNVPLGSSISWSSTPSGAVSFSNNSDSPTVTWLGGNFGSITLTATIVSTCGSIEISKDVSVGGISENDLQIIGDDLVCYGNYLYTVQYNGDISILNYDWNVPSGWSVTPVSNPHPNQAMIYIPPYESFPQTIELFVQTECGYQGAWFFEVWDQSIGCASPFAFSVYPNPVDDEFMIVGKMEFQSTQNDMETVIPNFSATLFDQDGNPKLEGYSADGQILFKTDHLRSGIYVLHILNDGEKEERKILIQH
ncbi:T9SS type A sorting domain-containing protein [Belliella sp. R4-6]|uniref:T9SS type A sorting domain-containing protein n=1 Tax=Belliella alkalica TaxID=1730871 RepID=A0ABS9VD21_9BACT|nr:T9SS type A sorting domain-containing protein [Belliella alkalica]MCH7414337.1 T9SS type A sorting domain-containing protein [Belliella alkalica]